MFMKNKILWGFLQFLISIKRSLWWLGPRFFKILAKIFGPVFRLVAWVHYKLEYFWKQLGLTGENVWWLRRSVMQAGAFFVLVFLSIPQTKILASKESYLAGRGTLAFNLINIDEDYAFEEVTAVNAPPALEVARQAGVVAAEVGASGNSPANIYVTWRDQDLAGTVAGGTALSKPIIMPGVNVSEKRSTPIEYIVKSGDYLGGIAYEFNIDIATILWENNLTLRSLLKPGQKLTILPVSGLTYTVKKGDTLGKIAKTYDAQIADIIKFNKLKEDGTDLAIGENILIPNGVRPAEQVAARAARTTQTTATVGRPPASNSAPSAEGFVWPSAARVITQYYGLTHHAIDVAGGNFKTPNYASKAGTVITSQCGWNSGYGCYVIIDHGGGGRTLYGHNSKLLVKVGDHVEAGETIGMMGNTGKVRGVTGIHLHFEVIINGVRKNPLGYVK